MIKKMELEDDKSGYELTWRYKEKINEIIEDNERFKEFVLSDLQLLKEAIKEYTQQTDNPVITSKDEPKLLRAEVCNHTYYKYKDIHNKNITRNKCAKCGEVTK